MNEQREVSAITSEERSFTREEFCRVEGISAASYYKMRRLGYGPVETTIPGTRIVRITAAARCDWHARMLALGQSEEAQLEKERRSAFQSELGKHAARSPRHVSKRRILAEKSK